MTFGLSARALTLIRGVFNHYPEITHVQIFGSRAMGNYRDNSDIDLVIRDTISRGLALTIREELDELPLPYLFDVLCYQQINHAKLCEHIDQCAQDLYIKSLC